MGVWMSVDGVLDDVVNQSLADVHRRFALRSGRIQRYHPAVAKFIGFPPQMTPDDWDDLAQLVPPDTQFVLRNFDQVPDGGFSVVATHRAVQLTGERLRARRSPEVVELTAADVPEMLALVERTRPGPFFERTVEMGTYLGIRHNGRLVAMAGERLRPPGWVEISAVCTDPDYRNRGYASILVAAVAAVIRDDGRIPFLHAAYDNEGAIRLYHELGFSLRRQVPLATLQAPKRTVPAPVGSR
ncbi:MAG: GNAT family N-acetyltransferase [Gordonia sp. (in: high G+C Gram-positive bacteria)]